MKKQNYEYDYKFDWIIRKNRSKEITPQPEDYKRKIREKLDDCGKPRRKGQDDEEEEAM